MHRVVVYHSSLDNILHDTYVLISSFKIMLSRFKFRLDFLCFKFTMLTANQQALRNGLSLEVDRLGELIGKLENKVLIIRPICDNKNLCVCCNTKTPSTKWHVSSGLNILRMIVTNASTLSLHNFTILTEY